MKQWCLLNCDEPGVETQLVPATAKRGPRVAAEYRGAKVLAPFNPNLDPIENHKRAAQLAFSQWCADTGATGQEKVWTVTGMDFGFTSFVFVPVYCIAAQEIAR